jgi:hypothetical protein
LSRFYFTSGEQELIIASVLGSCFMGLLIPIIPLVVAGMIMMCIYREDKKVRSILIGLTFAGIAIFASSIFFVYILGIEGNIYSWGLAYSLLFGLPYLFIFVWRINKIAKLSNSS